MWLEARTQRIKLWATSLHHLHRFGSKAGQVLVFVVYSIAKAFSGNSAEE